MNEQDLIGKTATIVGIDTGGGGGQSDFVSHITLDTMDGDWRVRVFLQATDPAHTWEIKTEQCPKCDGDGYTETWNDDQSDVVISVCSCETVVQRDPLHDALVAIFEAVAEREEKTVGQVVEELFSGYLGA